MSFFVRRAVPAYPSCLLILVSAAACGELSARNPVAPSAVAAPAVGLLAASPTNGNAQPFIEITTGEPTGAGGMANAVPTAAADVNVIEGTLNVHGAPPDTDLFFQIAHDAFLGPIPARADGVCDRALQFGFPNPPLHAGGDAGIIHTSKGGAGSTHVRFEIPLGFAAGAYDPGAQVDQMFRLVNSDQTFELRTACWTMTWR